MVHELIGISNGRVNLSLIPDIRPELSVSLLHWFTHKTILKTFLGSHIVHKHRLFLPGTSPSHVWRPRDTPQDLRPNVPIQIPSSRSIKHPIHRGHETICRRIPRVQKTRRECQ